MTDIRLIINTLEYIKQQEKEGNSSIDGDPGWMQKKPSII